MSILVRAISDTHGFWHDEELCNGTSIEPCDLLLHAGDMMPVTDHGTSNQRRFLVQRWAEWLDEVPAEKIVWTPGNHDFLLEKPWARSYLEKLPPKAVMLRGFSTTAFGLRIHGIPWSFSPEGWAFQAEHETAMERRCSQISENTDIILSHGPPAGYGDKTVSGHSIGSTALMQRIRQVRPKLVVYGHIHEGYGTWEWPPVADFEGDPVILANCSRLDENYEPKNAIQTFEL